MRLLIVGATLLIMAVSARPALAQTPVWTSHGPEGGGIAALTIDPRSPSTIYAGTVGDGVFKSTDAADRWNALGPANAVVATLAIDTLSGRDVRQHPGRHRGHPDDDAPPKGVLKHWPRGIDGSTGAAAVVYAGTLGAGVLKSTDGGNTWQPSNTGLTIRLVRALAIDPSNANVLYAGTTAGLFKSVDAGASWTSSGLVDADIRALVIDPETSNTVYAGTDFGVFKSVNAGATWSPMSAGITMRDIRALAINPNNPQTLYAGAGGGLSGGPGAVFKTTNGGELWANTGLAAPDVRAVAIDPEAGETVYVGGLSSNVLKTIDGGATWTASSTGLINAAVLSLSINPDTPSTVYAGTNDGVVKTIDAGATWAVVNTRLTNTFVFALALDRTTPTTLYAGMDQPEIFKTTDGAESWTLKNSGLTSFVSVQAVAIDGVTPSIIYAGLSGGGVFKSTDSGESWSAANAGLTHPVVQALATDPATAGIIYAGTAGGVFKSVNGAAIWTKTPLAVNVSAIAVDPVTTKILYTATPIAGVFKSEDAGESWSEINTGLPPGSTALALAIDPGTPTTVYVGIQGAGVFKSLDGGAHWSAVNTGLTNIAIQPWRSILRALRRSTPGRAPAYSKVWTAAGAGARSMTG